MTVAGQITDERLAEMLAAAEKATPGSRERHVIDASTYRYVEDAEKAVARDQADADFNALCDPQTITALLTELQHRREAGTPEGWKLIPRRPTEDMMQAGNYSAWVDMWDAAPSPDEYENPSKLDRKVAASPSSPA